MTTIKMPALSPTMEMGKLAKWLVKEGDKVEPGDLLAEIETDKATMEFEAVDEGVVSKILISAGTDDVAVGTDIAQIDTGEAEAHAEQAEVASDPDAAEAQKASEPTAEAKQDSANDSGTISQPVDAIPAPVSNEGERIKASPLARRIAQVEGVDLTTLTGSGPNGRIVKADVAAAIGRAPTQKAAPAATKPQVGSVTPAVVSASAVVDERIPHRVEKLSGMRKTIARRLTQSKQEAPHIYLTVDVRIDKLLDLRKQINASLEGRGIKVSVNDMVVKALGLALRQVPECNVSFAGEEIVYYDRADISVAVSIPNGLITPIVTNADGSSLSAIAQATADLAARAKDGKLKPEEYQGGSASISNMGMMGIKEFSAVINPPQGMILAVGAGERRPYVVDDALSVATVMSVTGSFDHRAIDGADAARLMTAFKKLVEAPLGILV